MEFSAWAKVAYLLRRFARHFIWLLALFVCLQPSLRAQTGEGAATSFTCSLSNSALYPGDVETISGRLEGLRTSVALSDLKFEWSGPNVIGNDETATFVVPNEPGIYTVHGKVSLKARPSEFWECSARVTVKAFEPPTLSCSVSPTTVNPGDSATVTASGVSPQNRPLTYSYTASSGTISGSGTTATLSTTGTPAGQVTVTCNVADDKGHVSSATVSIDVLAPSPPPAPQTELSFPWPPPKPSAQMKLPLNFGSSGLKKMGDIDQKLVTALDQLGYIQRAHYAIPGGFALVTQVEQIYSDGRSKPPPARFSDQLEGPRNFSDYLAGLITSDPGYYRVIVFVVTNVDVLTTAAAPDEDLFKTLLNGPDSLPTLVAVKSLAPATRCTALIYEFKKSGADKTSPAELMLPSPLSSDVHLKRAGLWARLSLP